MKWIKMNKCMIIIWLLMLVIVLNNSCEYKLSDVWYNPANENVEAPHIEVVKLSLGDVNDTIYLYMAKAVQFQFQSDRQEIIAVEFMLNDESVQVFESDNGWFYLSNMGLSNGFHILTLQVYTTSGTGSIAEQVGAEAFVISKTWTLVIDSSHKIWTRTEIIDGYLKVSWEKYRANDFKEYVVLRSVGRTYDVEVSRVRSNEYIDVAYVGEGGGYNIYINDIYDNLTYWCRLDMEREFPVLGSKPIENNVYRLYWNKSKYYSAVGRYEARVQLNHGTVHHKISLNANDTIFETLSANFSDRVTHTISLVPAQPNSLYQSNNISAFENRDAIRIGNYITNASLYSCEILQMDQNGFSFISVCDTLMRYSFEQKRVIQRLGYPPAWNCYGCTFSRASVSSSRKSFTANIACWDDVLMIDAENLYNYKVRDLKPYTGQLYSPNIPISDVGLAIINTTNNINSFYIYDFYTGTAVSYTPEFYATGGKISSNGKYLCLHDNSFKLVRYENSQFTTIGIFLSRPEYYEFDPLNSNQMFEWDRTNFYVRSVDDFSVIRQFPLSDEHIFNIDFHRGEILTQNAGHLYIRCIVTGKILKDIAAPFSNSRCFLVNSTLISENGVIHYIN